jgi:WD40 repeat protein
MGRETIEATPLRIHSHMTIHVFGIKPGSKGEEVGYAYPQWEPEPGDEATDEEYEAWEDRNPIWGLRDDLGCYLDCDFVEHQSSEGLASFGYADVWAYLATQIKRADDVEKIKEKLKDCRELVLIFDSALGGFEATMRDTDGAWYAGEYLSAAGYEIEVTPTLLPGDHSGRILIARTIAPGFVVTAGRYGEVKFWDTNEAQPIEVKAKYSKEDFVHAVAISPDRTTLYTCSDEVRQWDLTSRPITSRKVATHGGYQIGDLGLIPHQNRLAIACVDRTVGVIALDTGKEKKLKHDSRVVAVLPLPDGEHLVSVADSGLFSVWRLGSKPAVVRKAVLFQPITKLLLLNDQATILFGTERGKLVWWNWQMGETIRIVDAHQDGWVDAVELSSDGELLVTAGDRTAKVWRVSDGKPVACFQGHADRVKAACFIGNDHVASGSRDGTIRVWRISSKSNEEVASFSDVPDNRETVADCFDDPWEIHCLVADRNLLVAGETSGRVRILRFNEGKLDVIR